jgi:chaperonin GroES
MNFRPLGNKILLRILSTKERRRGLIILPPTVKTVDENQLEAVVLAVGEGKRLKNGLRRQMEPVYPGDKVLVAKFGGTRVWIEDALCLIVEDKEILAVFNEE